MATEREEALLREVTRLRNEIDDFVRRNVSQASDVSRVEGILNKIENTLSGAGEDFVEEAEESIREQMTGTLRWFADTLAMELGDALYKTTKQLGAGDAGFGQAGRDLGRSFGRAVGQRIDRRFSKSGLVNELKIFERVGSIAGDAILQTIQMQVEGFRMVGAQMAPTMTAGFTSAGGGQDFAQMGRQAVRTMVTTRLETGATIQQIATMADKISKLGLPYSDAGAKATQYALALSKVRNITDDVAAAMIEQAVRRHGQDWEAAGSSMEMFTAATSYWNAVNEGANDTMARSLSSLQTLLEMYQKVGSQLGISNVEMGSLTAAFLGFVSVSKEMGLRTGLMAQNIGNVMSGLFNMQSSNLTQMFQRSEFLYRNLERTEWGREILQIGEAHAQERGMDLRLNLPIILQEMFGQEGPDGDLATKFVGAIAQSVYLSTEPGMGGPMGSTDSSQNPLQVTFAAAGQLMNLSPTNVMTLRDLGRNITIARLGSSASPKEILRQLAVGGREGQSIDALMDTALGVTQNAMSVREQMTLELEKTFAADLAVHETNAELIKSLLPAGGTQAGVGLNIRGGGVAGGVLGNPSSVGTFLKDLLIPGHMARRSQREALQGAFVRRNQRGVVVSRSVSSPGGGVQEKTTTYAPPSAREEVERAAKRYFPNNPIMQRHVVATAMRESSFNPEAIGDSGRAVGMFQFWPALQKQYGVNEQSSPEEQADAGARYIRDLYSQHKGNVEEAMKEYHLGSSRYRAQRSARQSGVRTHDASRADQYWQKHVSVVRGLM